MLRSDTPDYSATLRSIRLNFTNPVAQGLSGEVTPFAVEQLGQPQRFRSTCVPSLPQAIRGLISCWW